MVLLDTKEVNIMGAPLSPIPLNVVGMDYNENLLVDSADEALLNAVVGAVKGGAGYERRFDLDFDDTIEASDLAALQSRLNLDLIQVIGKLDKRQSVQMTWGAYLCAVKPSEVLNFTRGWITIEKHPYIAYGEPGPEYCCRHFAADTLVASYKSLGYGRLLVAYSMIHAYIVFWTGDGDWCNFLNWKIVEPQSGFVYDILPYSEMMEAYKTRAVYFPRMATEPFFNEGVWKQNIFADCLCLNPDTDRLDGTGCDRWALGGWLEELAPVGDFDTSLGVWWT